MKGTCGECRFNRPRFDKDNIGECHMAPPVRLPRRFVDTASAGDRVRDETLIWGWPEIRPGDWCGQFKAEAQLATAPASALLQLQQRVAELERDRAALKAGA